MKAQERTIVKICVNCKEEKDLSLFGKNKKGKDGHLAECKNCRKLKRQALPTTNPEAYERQLQRARDVKASIPFEERQASKKAWDKKNEVHVKQYRRDNYNSVEACARTKAYREANPESALASVKRWKVNNPERARILKNKANIKRKLLMKNARVSWANQEAIQTMYDEAAQLTEETGIEYQVDHIIPYVSNLVCGLHVHNNLQVITASENFRKSNKF